MLTVNTSCVPLKTVNTSSDVSNIHNKGATMALTRHNDRDPQFTELVDTAAAGDHSAMNDLLRTLQPEINRYCHSSVKRSQTAYINADDVAQEALIGLYQALESRNNTTRCWRSFAYGIARNKIHDHHRRTTREQRAQLDEAPELADREPDPESVALHNERNHELAELLQSLSEYQREVLVLRQAAGYSAAETARRLGTTAGAVRVTQNRALRNLRRAAAADSA